MLDGVQGDQAWIHETFSLKRAMARSGEACKCVLLRLVFLLVFVTSGSWHPGRKHVCPYCSALSFLDPVAPETESLLYTAFGDSAAHRQTSLSHKPSTNQSFLSPFIFLKKLGLRMKCLQVHLSEASAWEG